jgi:hypothetical protein
MSNGNRDSGHDQEGEAAEGKKQQKVKTRKPINRKTQKKIHQKTQMKQTHRKNKLERRKFRRVAIHLERDALLQNGGPPPWPVHRLAHLTRVQGMSKFTRPVSTVPQRRD